MGTPRINLIETGKHIMQLRKEVGLSVKDVCDICGLTEQAVYKWQYGITLPTVDNLVILAHLFNTTIDEILVVV